MLLLKPHFFEMGCQVGQILFDHGHMLLVLLLSLRLDIRLVMENILHYLVFHSSGDMTTGVDSSPADVNAASMTTRMTTRMVDRRVLAHEGQCKHEGVQHRWTPCIQDDGIMCLI